MGSLAVAHALLWWGVLWSVDLEVHDKALSLIQFPLEPKADTKIKYAFRKENKSGKFGQMPKMNDYFKADIYQSLKTRQANKSLWDIWEYY